jgi:hypothetical protein
VLMGGQCGVSSRPARYVAGRRSAVDDVDVEREVTNRDKRWG